MKYLKSVWICSFLTFCLSLSACGSGGDSEKGDGGDQGGDGGLLADGGSDSDTDSDGDSDLPLVSGLEMTAIDAYQSIRLPIMANGAKATDPWPVPLLLGKDAMVRVYVKFKDTNWQPRKVKMVLDLTSGNKKVGSVSSESMVQYESTDTNLSTTPYVSIPGDKVVKDLQMKVSLYEIDKNAKGTDTSGSVWPKDGLYPLPAEDTGGPLEIIIIPVRYNADGSGRLPDTSDTQLETIKNAFFGEYAVYDIKITVADPLDYSTKITAMGGGWSQLLTKVQGMRTSIGATDKQYLYALFCPTDTFQQFCTAGCVAGLSNLAAQPSDAWARESVGIGWTGGQTATTMVHEVGHTHGREHAPCGLGGQPSDPKFPYAGASIGVWGYDLVLKKMKGPTSTKDFMSYCTPTWVSDYTYNALHARNVAVNALKYDVPPPYLLKPWLSISMDMDGSMRPGPEFSLPAEPGGQASRVEFLDPFGNVLGFSDAIFNPYSSISGGLILFPKPSFEIYSVRIPGFAPVVVP